MNETCQHKGCENPATLTLTFGGHGYRVCSTCEQGLRPEIVATAEAARKAAGQISGYLAGHFGTSIAQAAPLAEALVGQVVSGQPLDDVVGNFRQAVIQETAANQEPAVQGNVIQAQQQPHKPKPGARTSRQSRLLSPPARKTCCGASPRAIPGSPTGGLSTC